MSEQSKLVLVTGGAGFIGSHLCERLLAANYAVRILDNLSLGKKEWVPQHPSVEFLEGDVRDTNDCNKAVQGVDGVFHLAAMSKVAPSITDSEMMQFCIDNNVTGTTNILEAAKTNGVENVVYAASSTVYGNTPIPNSENSIPDCNTPYALTKYMGEQVGLLYDSLFQLPFCSLRLFQVYGPRQPSSGPYAVVAGIFIEQAKSGNTLTIHGDGSQSRDFVHVSDVAEAFVRAYEKNVHGQPINIGTGKRFSIKELADLISDNQTLGLDRRTADLEATQADTSRLQEQLGWIPSTDFHESIQELIDLSNQS